MSRAPPQRHWRSYGIEAVSSRPVRRIVPRDGRAPTGQQLLVSLLVRAWERQVKLATWSVPLLNSRWPWPKPFTARKTTFKR